MFTLKLSEFFLISIIVIIWLFDTFSFLGGKIIGGKKLMPKISSGKTISGLLSGFFVTLILAILLFSYSNISIGISITLTLFIILFAFAGDTVASLIKRYASLRPRKYYARSWWLT